MGRPRCAPAVRAFSVMVTLAQATFVTGKGRRVSVDAPSGQRLRTGRQVVVLALVTGAFVWGHIWYENRNHFFDLGIYRDAMRWWAEGNFLYDFSRPNPTQGVLDFTYPPFAALLLRPLAWLTMPEAVWAYSIVAVAAFAASMWWLVRPIADRHGLSRWFGFGLAVVLATGLEPIREAYTFGQINFVLWALILLDLLVLLPRGSRFVGVGIGLATAIKLVPAIFILYLLVTRRWRAAAVAAGTAVAVTLLTWAVAPQESWVFFSDRLLHAEGIGRVSYEFNQSLMGLLARFAAPAEPSQLGWLLLAVPVLIYGLWRAGRAAAAGDEVAGLTMVGLAGSLVSPVTWAHHIFWVVPALVVLVDAALRPADVTNGLRRRAGLVALAAAYLTVTFSVVALWAFKFEKPGGVVGVVMSNWYVWLMLALLVALPIRRGLVQPQVAV